MFSLSLSLTLLPFLSLFASRYAICGMNDFIVNLANNSHHSEAIFIESQNRKILQLFESRLDFLMRANQFLEQAKLINLSFAF